MLCILKSIFKIIKIIFHYIQNYIQCELQYQKKKFYWNTFMFTFIEILSTSIFVFTLQMVELNTCNRHVVLSLLSSADSLFITWQHFDCHEYPIFLFYFPTIRAFSWNQNKKGREKWTSNVTFQKHSGAWIMLLSN